jgi:hypothetical protein
MTDERVIYRVRKTVLEMLKDRGYKVADAEIEEPFETFEERYAKVQTLNFLAHRQIQSTLPIAAEN